MCIHSERCIVVNGEYALPAGCIVSIEPVGLLMSGAETGYIPHFLWGSLLEAFLTPARSIRQPTNRALLSFSCGHCFLCRWTISN